MTISRDRIRRTQELIEWLHKHVDGMEAPDTPRTKASLACHNTAQLHVQGVLLLVSYGLYSSAFALLRPAFEAYVRGEWLYRCGSDEQVEEFIRCELGNAHVKKLLQDLRCKAPHFPDLDSMREKCWSAMCDYTHTGGLTIQRFIRGGDVIQNFDDKQVEWLLCVSEFIGLLSVGCVDMIANNGRITLTEDEVNKMITHWNSDIFT